MAFATLYRFQVELSDVDRGVYETLDFRAAQHPSEAPAYLITRVLAYILNAQEGLEFSPEGLSDPDAPCLLIKDLNGGTRLWIEIGNPSQRKLHRASKAADEVKVYTYKNPELLLKDLDRKTLHQSQRLGIFSFDPKFLERLALALERNNHWNVMHTDARLVIVISDSQVEESTVEQHQLI